MAESGRESSPGRDQKHTMGRMATAYLDLWKEMMAGPPAPRLHVRELTA